MSFPYRDVFQQVEETLLSYGSRHRPLEEIRSALLPFRTLGSTYSDASLFEKLTLIVFYSGFRASTVTAKIPVIRAHFPGYAIVAAYGDEDVRRIMADSTMIRNERKIRAVIANARAILGIVREFGSFQAYLDGFRPGESIENVMLLKRDLQARFSFLGGVTAYHFLTDIGLPVLKPDRVLCRIFHRLGLVQDDKDIESVVRHGRCFADATGHPIRYIDIIFVAYGQAQSEEFGIDKGICLTDPRCTECRLQPHCQYHHGRHTF